jgi:riboflavin kinase / FMN adenylyltransferase
MKTAHQPEELHAVAAPVVLAIGFLDGVHRGHRAVLRAARRAARAGQGQTWALTFEPHPLQILQPDRAPALLTPLDAKLRLLAAARMDGCVVMPFTHDLARVEPEAFLERLFRAMPSLAGVAVGANWAFGRGARGDVTLLRRQAGDAGIPVTVVPPVLVGGKPVSSTRIREAIAAGRLGEAARLLGRPHALSGPVEEGRRVGRRLGYPTANIRPGVALAPPPGVYAARVRLGTAVHPAAAYLGTRATFGVGGPPVLEVHLLDFEGDLYGRTAEVELLRQIREDRQFSSETALRARIARDIEACRQAVRRATGLRGRRMRRTRKTARPAM